MDLTESSHRQKKRRWLSLMWVDITQFIEYLSGAKRQREWKSPSELIHLLLPSNITDHGPENLDYRTDWCISFSSISQHFSFSYTIRSFAFQSAGLSKLLITDFSGSLVHRQTVYHGVPQSLKSCNNESIPEINLWFSLLLSVQNQV